MEKTQVTWTQTDKGLGSYLEDLGARLGSFGDYLTSLGGYIARLGEALWGVKPALSGKASVGRDFALPNHLSPAAATDDKTFWQRATRFRNITLECSEQFSVIKEKLMQEPEPLKNLTGDIAHLSLPHQFFRDIASPAVWEFNDETTQSYASVYSGPKEDSSVWFQKAWRDQVERLAPKGTNIDALLPDAAVAATQTIVLESLGCLRTFVGETRRPVDSKGPDDQIYRIVAEGGKLFVEGEQKMHLLNMATLQLDGEVTIKSRVDLGSKTVYAGFGVITRYDTPVARG